MSEILTEGQLAEIEQHCTASTSGPWEWTYGEWETSLANTEGAIVAEVFGLPPFRSKADATFTALARTDIPVLLAEVRRLRAREQQWQAALLHLESTNQQAYEAFKEYLNTNNKKSYGIFKKYSDEQRYHDTQHLGYREGYKSAIEHLREAMGSGT